MTPLQTFELSDYTLQCGTVLPHVRLCYRTWGSLAADRSNLVLFPTWFSSTDEANAWLIGPGRPLDPAKYFIVCVNLLGNGVSSSPSNVPAPFDRMRFPAIAMLDNVRLAAALLDTQWRVDAPVLVLGRSMGAQFAFQWGCWFPQRTRSLFCLCGSARTTPHNQAFLEGVRACLTSDAGWADGEYATPPRAGLEAMGVLYAGWAMSSAFYRSGLHLTEGDADVAGYVRRRWRPNFLRRDANDLLSMMGSWSCFDPSDNPRHHGQWETALAGVEAPAIVMPSRTDMYFPPEDSAIAAALMPSAELRVLESVWGHRAGSPGSAAADIAQVDQAIADLLARAS